MKNTVPRLSDENARIFILVLLLGPVFFGLGYQFIKSIFKTKKFNFVELNFKFSPFQAHFIYILLFLVVIFELIKQDAFTYYYSWNVYEYWFKARWALFQKIPFFGYVLIYRILPIAAALCVITPYKTLKGRLLGFLPYLLTIVVDFFIYQKTPILLTTLTCFGAFFLKKMLIENNHFSIIISKIFILFFSLFLIYFVIITAPSSTAFFQKKLGSLKKEKLNKVHFFTQSLIHKKSFSDEKNASRVKKDDTLPVQALEIQRSVSNKQSQNDVKSVKMDDTSSFPVQKQEVIENVMVYHPEYELTSFQYAVFTIFSRFGGVLFHYIETFPLKHDFYSFDFGQDILGFGSMPDDNYVVWDSIYPGIEGCCAAPANFSFYTQGGLKTVFIAMFFLGSWVALVWCYVLQGNMSIIFRTLLGVITILFSLQLAMDSARNLIICSYGYFWAFLFLLLLLGLSNLKFFKKNDIYFDALKS